MRRAITYLMMIALISSAAWFCLKRASAQGAAAPTQPTGKPRKRALLVGISKYQRAGKDPSKEWWDLSTATDIKLLKETLIRKFQFEPQDIKCLTTPQETTHTAIVEAFRQHLIKPTQPGDIIFFHFSGHGQFIPDDGDDELDGYDESLVPSDYVSRQDGLKNIRDDKLGALLDELKLKKPTNVTITLDSCYSGTGTRGELPVRGGPWAGDPVPRAKVHGEETSASGLLTRGAGPATGYVFISAAGPKQVAQETYNEANQPMGLFTWALLKALDKAGPSTTYRDLFEQLNDLVTRKQGNQNPQLEGELDKQLMAGTALKPERYIGVKTDERNNVILQAGKLQGMTKGSRFGVYAEGTKSPQEGNKLADAEITQVDLTTSRLKLAGNVSPDKLRAARAFETEHFYDESLLKVVIQNPGNLASGREIQAQVKSFELAEAVTRGTGEAGTVAYDVLIHPPAPKDVSDKVIAANFRGVILERQNGSVIATIPEGPEIAREVKKALEREMRWLTIKSLENTDPGVKIELRLVPVEVELNSDGYVSKVLADKKTNLTTGSQLEFKLGDHIMLEVRNTGDSPAHVTILNLRSDGKVGPGWPQQLGNIPPPDNLIKNDGRWVRIKEPYVFRISEPVGLESFRAIATREPTDFTPLIDEELLKRGDPGTPRGENAARSILGRLLTANQQGRRSGINMAPPPAWATATVHFMIREK
jgi:metacaspase-1